MYSTEVWTNLGAAIYQKLSKRDIFHYIFIDTSWDALSDTKLKTKAKRMTSQKIHKYFTFNIEKSYTYVDVQVIDEGGRD